MNELIELIERIGFPAAVCVALIYLLVQQRKSIDQLSVAINKLIVCIETFKTALTSELKETIKTEIKQTIREEFERQK